MAVRFSTAIVESNYATYKMDIDMKKWWHLSLFRRLVHSRARVSCVSSRSSSSRCALRLPTFSRCTSSSASSSCRFSALTRAFICRRPSHSYIKKSKNYHNGIQYNSLTIFNTLKVLLNTIEQNYLFHIIHVTILE